MCKRDRSRSLFLDTRLVVPSYLWGYTNRVKLCPLTAGVHAIRGCRDTRRDNGVLLALTQDSKIMWEWDGSSFRLDTIWVHLEDGVGVEHILVQ